MAHFEVEYQGHGEPGRWFVLSNGRTYRSGEYGVGKFKTEKAARKWVAHLQIARVIRVEGRVREILAGAV